MQAIACLHSGERPEASFLDNSAPNGWTGLCKPTPVQRIVTVDPLTRGALVGPLDSLPLDWHTVVLWNFTELEPGDRVVEFVADAVAAPGGPTVQFPPLHLHHIHVAGGGAGHWFEGHRVAAEIGAHWFETHGDYAASASSGYGHRIPPPFCRVYHGYPSPSSLVPIFVNAQVEWGLVTAAYSTNHTPLRCGISRLWHTVWAVGRSWVTYDRVMCD